MKYICIPLVNVGMYEIPPVDKAKFFLVSNLIRHHLQASCCVRSTNHCNVLPILALLNGPSKNHDKYKTG